MNQAIEAFISRNQGHILSDLPAADLVAEALNNGEGGLTETGALMCDTGQFTGRSPKDRYIVDDELTSASVWWGDINKPFPLEKFDALLEKMIAYAEGRKLYMRHALAGADERYALGVRVINTHAWHNLFCLNMFIAPNDDQAALASGGFTILHFPEFKADPATDGTRQQNFAILNLKRKIILIGGTGYAGEIKKGIFSVLNFILPHQHGVLSMHCSANIGDSGDTAVFFGLSGTGKTTLSADPARRLIGDDEHGWSEEGVFNFEGGCYAKTINLSEENEPDIYRAIRFGAIVENSRFLPGTKTIDFANTSVTENTRTAYPIGHIDNIAKPSVGGIPQNIFFLTCDAHGVLPPISKLDKGQAMYHFISGYTAKVAGTEEGVTEPQTVFSACFGAPFLPLHPTAYAEMLGQKMDDFNVNIWLVNTGWTGGPYGVGSRIKLKYTRAMITAALAGALAGTEYRTHELFKLQVPVSCPGVPSELLDPAGLWADADAYAQRAELLAKAFTDNFEKYRDYATQEIMDRAPNSMAAIK